MTPKFCEYMFHKSSTMSFYFNLHPNVGKISTPHIILDKNSYIMSWGLKSGYLAPVGGQNII